MLDCIFSSPFILYIDLHLVMKDEPKIYENNKTLKLPLGALGLNNHRKQRQNHANYLAHIFSHPDFNCRFWYCTRSRSEEHTSELQSRFDLVCRLLLEKK